MILVQDLGTRSYGNTGQVKRYGLYICPSCELEVEARVDHVKSGRTTQCKECAFHNKNREANCKASSNFISSAITVHGDIYDYTNTRYINARTKIVISCRTHGEFLQMPTKHLAGSGCPLCARDANDIAKRMYSTKPTLLYYIHLPQLGLYKIGCTSLSLTERFKGEKLDIIIIATTLYLEGAEAYRKEKQLLGIVSEYKYRGANVLKHGGDTELFTKPLHEIV